MAAIAIFGVIGFRVGVGLSFYRYLWVPILLVLLSGCVLLCMVARVIVRKWSRKNGV